MCPDECSDALRMAECAALLVEVILPEQSLRHHLRKIRAQSHIESQDMLS
jgi:hypothetical protein